MKINSFVYLNKPDGGAVCLPPGEVPEWAVPLITNKAVIVAEAVAAPVIPEAPKIPETPVIEVQKAEDAGDDDVPDDVPIPPKGGRGGSAEAWAKYAASKGFEVEGDAKASDIREGLEAEGIPTE